MEKIKLFMISEKGKDILVIMTVVLVGSGCFLLGRLSKEDNNNGISVVYPNNTTGNLGASVISSKIGNFDALEGIEDGNTNNIIKDKIFFGSSKGKKYYTLGCSAGKTIKKENRIYFNTKEEAEGRGYVLSSSCN